jgi:DNA-binding NarL/FixJ family response regulator
MSIERLRTVVVSHDAAVAQPLTDLLAAAGMPQPATFTNSDDALQHIAQHQVNFLVVAFSTQPVEGLAWVRAFRRRRECRSHKAPVLVVADGVTASLSEACRNAGANAVIEGQATRELLVRAIRKVLARPRPFVDDDTYVGPCRRSGIVVVGARYQRRAGERLRQIG